MLLDVKLFWVSTDYVVHSPGLDKAFDAFWVHKYCCNNDSQGKLSCEDAINLPEKTYNRKKMSPLKTNGHITPLSLKTPSNSSVVFQRPGCHWEPGAGDFPWLLWEWALATFIGSKREIEPKFFLAVNFPPTNSRYQATWNVSDSPAKSIKRRYHHISGLWSTEYDRPGKCSSE